MENESHIAEPKTWPTTQYRSRLHRNLAEYFKLEELNTLCFDLNINYENLPANTLDGKARELVKYCADNGITPDLVAKCRKLRPKVDWEGEYTSRKPLPTPNQFGNILSEPVLVVLLEAAIIIQILGFIIPCQNGFIYKAVSLPFCYMPVFGPFAVLCFVMARTYRNWRIFWLGAISMFISAGIIPWIWILKWTFDIAGSLGMSRELLMLFQSMGLSK